MLKNNHLRNYANINVNLLRNSYVNAIVTHTMVFPQREGVMRSNVTHMQPRAVRPAPEPLALYLRAGRNDHLDLMNLLAAGDNGCFGVVIEATQHERHKELKEQVLAHRLDAILDTKAMQLALPGGYTPPVAKLPWANKERMHTPADFQGLAGRRLIASIGDFVIKHGYTEVMAPTHLLREFDDEWLTIDVEAARWLRDHLDQNGGRDIPLIYPIAISYEILRTPHMRARVINALVNVKADAIWLKVDGFNGAHATPTAVKNFIEAAGDFHQLRRKLVADCVGGKVGLALMAFGAVGGISHGIGLLEKFSSDHLRSIKSGPAFAPTTGVYFPGIDAMLTQKETELLFGAGPQAKAAFACRDMHCCKRGIKDMTESPKRHFVVQRMQQVAQLSQFPETIRAHRFLELNMRPTTDRALQAASQAIGDEALAKKLQKNRKRLDAMRVALGKQLEKSPPHSYAAVPETRAAREARINR